ncbi:hypothetical protein Hanom_Chr12g01105401 [Helianthus anomalus]
MALDYIEERNKSKDEMTDSDDMNVDVEKTINLIKTSICEKVDEEVVISHGPWNASESDYECALMAATQVNENLRKNVFDGEDQLEKIIKEFKSKITEKDQEISRLKHEATITKVQFQTIMIEKYKGCKKELEYPNHL